MCPCDPTTVCDYHFAKIEELYLMLREAERNNTEWPEPLRLALAEYGSAADLVILAVEGREAA